MTCLAEGVGVGTSLGARRVRAGGEGGGRWPVPLVRRHQDGKGMRFVDRLPVRSREGGSGPRAPGLADLTEMRNPGVGWVSGERR